MGGRPPEHVPARVGMTRAQSRRAVVGGPMLVPSAMCGTLHWNTKCVRCPRSEFMRPVS